MSEDLDLRFECWKQAEKLRTAAKTSPASSALKTAALQVADRLQSLSQVRKPNTSAQPTEGDPEE